MRADQATERIVVGVSGSVANLASLHAAVGAARHLAVRMIAVLAWTPVGGELAYRRAPCPQLLRMWQRAAQERLTTAFDEAFGGVPDDVGIQGLVIRGEAGPVLTGCTNRPGDLLIVGTGRPLRRSVSRYCARHANCSVQLIAPPAMIHDLRRQHWAGRDQRHAISELIR